MLCGVQHSEIMANFTYYGYYFDYLLCLHFKEPCRILEIYISGRKASY